MKLKIELDLAVLDGQELGHTLEDVVHWYAMLQGEAGVGHFFDSQERYCGRAEVCTGE
jgi:hypothetical protein